MSIKLSRTSSTIRFTNFATMTTAIITTIVFIATFSSMALAQTDKDSAAVHAQVDAYQSVWNTHGSAAVARFFSKDADLVMGNLPIINGRKAIQGWWKNYFAKQEPERSATFVVNSVRLLTADVALVNITSTTGGRDTLGQQLLIRKARGTWVLHQQNGNWLISAMRGMPTDKDSVVLKTSLETTESLKPDIRVFVDAFEDAWNNHDPSIVSTFFRNDADIIVRNDPLIHGSQAIEDWWRAYFSKPRPYRALLIIDEIRMINSNVALLNVVGTGALQNTQGEELPIRYTRATWVLVKEAGNWIIAALRVLPSEDDLVIRRDNR